MNIDYIKDNNKKEALELLFYLWGDNRAEHFIESLIINNEIIGCFSKENDILGIITFKIISNEIEINEIIARPDCRNKGVGTALINGLISKVSPDILRLELRKSNKNALFFYQKLDFKVVGERINYYQNPIEDAFLLTRIIK